MKTEEGREERQAGARAVGAWRVTGTGRNDMERRSMRRMTGKQKKPIISGNLGAAARDPARLEELAWPLVTGLRDRATGHRVLAPSPRLWFSSPDSRQTRTIFEFTFLLQSNVLTCVFFFLLFLSNCQIMIFTYTRIIIWGENWNFIVILWFSSPILVKLGPFSSSPFFYNLTHSLACFSFLFSSRIVKLWFSRILGLP